MPRLKWIDLLLPSGVAVLLASVLIAGRLPGSPNYYLAGGVALLVAHVVLRREAILSIARARQARYGGNAVVLTVTVLAILVFLNWIVNRHVNRWDLSKEQRSALSEQSKKIVRGLKENVKITYFPNLQSPEGEEQTRAVRDQLREYQAFSSRISLEVVDGMREPRKVQSFGVTTVPTMVVERGSRQERISNTSEQDITNALIKVTREQKRTVCFVKGEGERDINASTAGGLSEIKQALESSAYSVSTVSLFGDQNALAVCSLLVVAGPEKDLTPDGVEAVRRFVKDGGSVFVMAEPELKTAYPNLTALIKEWNVETDRDVLMEYGQRARLTARGLEPIAEPRIVVLDYPSHEITKDMDGLASLFWMARSVQPGAAAVDGVSVRTFLETSKRSWADKDLTLTSPDQSRGRSGPISLGVAVTIKAEAPKSKPTEEAEEKTPKAEEQAQPKETRIAVVGDVDFASNAAIEAPGNRDLFLNTVSWLVQESDLISIRPKEAGEQRLRIMPNSSEFWLMVTFALLVMPGLFVVWGVVVWWRRR